MSVWDTYGMKTEIILAKSWIQASKDGYGNRFDEFSKFFWEGVGFIFFCLFAGRGRMLVKKKKIGQVFNEMGRREAPRAHIRR